MRSLREKTVRLCRSACLCSQCLRLAQGLPFRKNKPEVGLRVYTEAAGVTSAPPFSLPGIGCQQLGTAPHEENECHFLSGAQSNTYKGVEAVHITKTDGKHTPTKWPASPLSRLCPLRSRLWRYIHPLPSERTP